METIECNEVETLIVKDLSRLWREYLQVGYYTEMYFLEKGVRFIAINDSVNSLVESSNDFNSEGFQDFDFYSTVKDPYMDAMIFEFSQ